MFSDKNLTQILAPFDRPRLRYLNRKALVFLCGSSQHAVSTTPGVPVRTSRDLLTEYLETHVKGVTISLIAENLFLKQIRTDDEGRSVASKNLLRFEQGLADLADVVVLFVETISVAAELGAFVSNSDLVKKLLIVNDRRYEAQQSFINLGPVDIVRQQAGPTRVMFANMDTVATTFGGIAKTVVDTQLSLGKSESFAELSKPGLSHGQIALVHDLVYILQPVRVVEIERAMSAVFKGSKAPELYPILAVLIGIGWIQKTEEGLYVSQNRATQFSYDLKKYSEARSEVIRLYYRNAPDRL